MSFKAAVSVRFDADMDARLKSLSEQSGISAADLVRRATEEYLTRIEQQGAINIPITIREPRATYEPSTKKRA